MKKLTLLLCLMSGFTYAGELKITRFVMLDPYTTRNTTAEVCVSITPAPEAPVLVQLTVDPGTRSKAYYTTWVDERGSNCHLVSSFRGRIEAKASDQKVASSL